MKQIRISAIKLTRQTVIFTVLSVLILSGILRTTPVYADKYEEQIRALELKISESERSKDHLNIAAEDLTVLIADLQHKINVLEGEIQTNQRKHQELEIKIAQSQVQLAVQRKLLGSIIAESYTQGDISTLEMLASSKNLSDYFDQETYRINVQNKIKKTLDKVVTLQQQLKTQKTALDNLLADQATIQSNLNTQRTENAQLLALNQEQRAAYSAQIKQNNQAIAQIRKLQAAANGQLYASGSAPKGSQGGGGYPAVWANAPIDSIVDSWGMYNRECVSYTAWKVASTGRYMPYWGGRGNAKQWPDNARAAGIPVDGNPRVGDVAISTRGTYGHSMYVEAVNGDGTITVSQYNASWDGNYSVARVYATGLQFIHF